MDYQFYLTIFFITAIISFLFTLFFKKIAPKIGAIDQPNERKIHKKPIARLGGVAIFIALFSMVSFFLPWDKHIWGVFIGSAILLFFGILDDIFGLNPWIKLIGQILSAIIIVIFGMGISFITNPFGGYLMLDSLKFPIDILGTTYHIVLFADLFTVFWIVLVINAVNFLDGVDGLASGVSGIAALILFLLSLSPYVNQVDTAILSLILAGATLGFLPLNFYPAKIFMGDSGSMFLGFILAVLAIISGGKVATALLILGLPIIDLLWAVLRRILSGKSPFRPDKKHFHHELLNIGLSQKQTVLIIYTITASFGIFSLFARSAGKLIALSILILIIVLSISYISSSKVNKVD
jgi:UDP-GlcNAc:undecaprenyl-phosphate GlcNAc-1-phosphate transferase